jgi:hypothetical protein
MRALGRNEQILTVEPGSVLNPGDGEEPAEFASACLPHESEYVCFER